jgi:hypothetical protein
MSWNRPEVRFPRGDGLTPRARWQSGLAEFPDSSRQSFWNPQVECRLGLSYVRDHVS